MGYNGFFPEAAPMYPTLQSMVPAPGGPVAFDDFLAHFPSLRPLATTPQDPEYHAEGDVWTHTKWVIRELVDDPAYAAAGPDTRFVLFYSALLHDIAKPVCTLFEDNGRISSRGHSGMGAIDARILLWKEGVPFALRDRICRIISTHQVPFHALGHDRRGRRPEFILHTLSWEGPVCDLATVAGADMRGRTSVHRDNCLADLELFGTMALEEGCWTTPKAFASAHTRLEYVRQNGAVSLDHPFHQEAGSKVIVMAGLPASGKNTWVGAHCPDLEVLSYDDAKARLGLRHGDNPGAAVHAVTDRAKVLLAQKAPFVWNATHLSPDMRGKTLDLLYRYHAEVRVVYLEQPPSVLFTRNDRRDSTLSNSALEAMLTRWDIPLPHEAHEVSYEVTDMVHRHRPKGP
jgi:predicted kinase